jgi:chromosome segregation ATPase
MVKISINGKALNNREFYNMAQALAFAYQHGECYGAKVVEIAQEGAGSTGGPGAVGGFTQADVDAACEKYCKEANEQLISQLEALNTDNESKDNEIKALYRSLEEAKTALEAKGNETELVVEKAADDVAKAANDEIVALEEQVKAKDAEIAELKAQLSAGTLEAVSDALTPPNESPANPPANPNVETETPPQTPPSTPSTTTTKGKK